MPFFGIPIRNGLPIGLGTVAGLSGPTAAPSPPPPVTSDPYFEYVPLLLNTTSTNGAQNNTFLDSSTNNFTVTRNGDTTQGSFNPYMPSGYWSGFFDGTGDYLSLASNAAFDIGSSDFTVECWFYSNSFAAGQGLISRYNFSGSTGSGWVLQIPNSTTLRFVRGNDIVLDCTVSLTVGQWYHAAAVRSGSTLTVYLNGTQVGQATGISNFADATTALQIGRTNTVTNDLNGYISNVRVVKGTAVYTANFTPPTTPLPLIIETSLLCLQDNRFKDNGPLALTITRNGDTRISKFAPFNPPASYSTASYGGSGFFDGTGDYLSLASNAALDLGSSDFCIEGFVYLNSLPASTARYAIAGKWGAAVGNLGYLAQIFNDSGTIKITFDYSTTGSAVAGTFSATATPTANTWDHIAFTRSGSTFKIFLNGVEVLSGTLSATIFDANSSLFIGSNSGTSNYIAGYVSNLRIVKGTAVYTAAFTPPTTPLTAITNTSLLLNFTNAGIYDAATINDGQTVGNAQVSTTQAKWSPTSMAFDGTGDAIVLPRNVAYSFGGDFTIECWVYYSTSAIQALFDTRNTDSLSAYLLDITASDKLDFVYGTSVRVTSATSIPKNQWVHVAVARSSGTIRLFIDGALDANTASTSAAITAASFPSIGGGRSTIADSVTGYYLNGYIQDLRITNGYARYTANFTPPTAAFPTL